jgi:hypothetical protein
MPLECLYRPARGWTMAGGTIEIHRNIVASHALRHTHAEALPLTPRTGMGAAIPPLAGGNGR